VFSDRLEFWLQKGTPGAAAPGWFFGHCRLEVVFLLVFFNSVPL
jgi:hypothetical protein